MSDQPISQLTDRAKALMALTASMPELVSLILVDTDKKTRVLSATVNKLWWGCAVRIIWRYLDQLDCMFDLFSTTGAIEKYKMNKDADWVRFNTYAVHVRRLVVNMEKANWGVSQAFKEMFCTRSMSSILPNLLELDIKTGVDTYSPLLLIPEGLQRLTVHPYFYKGLDVLFTYVIPSTQSLVYLCIDSEKATDSRKYEETFNSALQELTALKDLTITNVHLTSAMLRAVAFLPALTRFNYSPGEHALDVLVGGVPESGASASGDEEKKLSTLKNAVLTCQVETLHRFLHLNVLFWEMEELTVKTTEADHEKIEYLNGCFKLLRLVMRNLSSLSLDLKFCKNKTTKLKFDGLVKLSDLHGIRSFSLFSTTPITITNADVNSLIRNWSDLVHFRIDWGLNSKFTPRTTLRAINSFATYCKNIEFLSIPVNATKAALFPQGTQIAPLKKLWQLNFGYSPISNPDHIALYLCRLCTIRCQLAVPAGGDLSENESAWEHYRVTWFVLSSYLEIILKAREEERKSLGVMEAVKQYREISTQT